MKYIKTTIITILLIYLIIPSNILADSFISIDNNDIMIAKGSKEKITVSLNNAAGRFDIDATDKNIAIIDKDKIFLDKSSEEIEIEGMNNGKTKINICATDVNTYDYQELNDLVYTINITVYTKGDIDNNGNVDLGDVTTLLKKYLGTEEATKEDIVIFDMNNNGKIELNDLVELLKIYLGIN